MPPRWRVDGGLEILNNNSNQFVGRGAGANPAGSFNYFAGMAAGQANTAGSCTYFSGYEAGAGNTSGSSILVAQWFARMR